MLNATRFLCRAALLLLLVPFARPAAAQSPAPAAAATLADALNPDGTLRAGLTGSFDASGYRLSTGADGQPAFTPTGVGDQLWADFFGHPGVNNNIYSLLVAPNGDVIVGGLFQNAGGNPNADYLARWDGTAWQSYGQGFSGGVQALLLLPNGDLIVGGSFQALNNQPNTRALARWNGTAWSGFGTGIQSGTVEDLALNASGDLVVVGSFQDAGGNANADRVARWNGISWRSYGTGVPYTLSVVLDVLILPSDDVVIGGNFDDAGNNFSADNIARWDGTAWQAFAPGLNGDVQALALLPNGNIVAGGRFTRAGGTDASSYLARFDGTAWQPFGTGVNGFVAALTVDPAGNIIAGGSFTNAGGNSNADYLSCWDGIAWRNYGPAFDLNILAVALAPNGDLVAGGQRGFSATTRERVRRWTGSTWQPLEDRRQHGVDNIVWTVAVAANGDLLIGGDFRKLEGDPTLNYIARWNGARWVRVGTGLNGTIYDIKVAPNGDIYAGGLFFNANGDPNQNCVARFDGTAWRAIGTGATQQVNAVAVAPNGDVYVGGFIPSSFARGYLQRFNGTAWSNLGSGVAAEVRAIVAAPSGDVFIGGEFTGAGGVAGTAYIAKWNGTTFSALGTGLGASVVGVIGTTVYALALAPNGDLIAGGNFGSAGGNFAGRNIARWNGSTWRPIGTGTQFTNFVKSLAVAANGDIIAGGNFLDNAFYPSRNRIARFDGTAWQPLGTGLDGVPNSVAVTPTGAVLAAGYFTGTFDGSRAFSFFGAYQFSTSLATHHSSSPKTNLTLYPNPAKEITTLALPAVAVARPVRVLDALGREVRRTVLPAGAVKGQLNVSNLPAGVYFVSVGSAVGRLVVE